MLPFNQQNQRGFTLTEIIVTLVIVGVLAAVAAPSLWGLYNRNKINTALTEVEGAFKEAQREAVRRGKRCEVTLDKVNYTVTGPCLSKERDLKKINPDLKLDFDDPGTLATTTFSFQGTTTDDGTIVIYQFPSAD